MSKEVIVIENEVYRRCTSAEVAQLKQSVGITPPPMAPERHQELLALAGYTDDPAKLPPAIQKIVDHHVAITHRPASSHAYFDAEQAIRKAATTETISRNRVGMSQLDEPTYKAAVREYCRRVEYPLPTGFAPLALSAGDESAASSTMTPARRKELLAMANY